MFGRKLSWPSLSALRKKLATTLVTLSRRIPFIRDYLAQKEYLAWLEAQVKEIYNRHKRLEARLMEIEKNHQELSQHFAELLEFHRYLQKRVQFLQEALQGLFDTHKRTEERLKLIETMIDQLVEIFRSLEVEQETSKKKHIFDLPDLRTLSDEKRTIWVILRLKGQSTSRGIFSEN